MTYKREQFIILFGSDGVPKEWTRGGEGVWISGKKGDGELIIFGSNWEKYGGFYKNGKKEGKHITHPDIMGQFSEEEYSNDKLHGEKITYDSIGGKPFVWRKESFKNGKEDGDTIQYFPNGNIEKIFYKNGDIEEFWDNGQIKSRILGKIPNLESTDWDKNGKITRHTSADDFKKMYNQSKKLPREKESRN